MAEKHSLSDEGCGEVVAVNAPFTNDANQLCLQLFLNTPSLFQLKISIYRKQLYIIVNIA